MFPDAEEDYVKRLLRYYHEHVDPESVVCNLLLENPEYPRKAGSSPADPDRSDCSWIFRSQVCMLTSRNLLQLLQGDSLGAV